MKPIETPADLHKRPARAVRLVVFEPFVSYGVEVGKGTKPIYLYLRLSKYHGDTADSIQRQRVDLQRKLASDGGWTAMGEYVDNDSASRSAVRTRRGWHELNNAIQSGQVTAVAFWKLDRNNRVAASILEWLASCIDRDVTLVSHEDDDLNLRNASSKLVVGIKSLFAEIETDTMSDRQLAAKRHAAEAGFLHGGMLPFGWQAGPRLTDEHGRTGRRLVEHPVEFPALREAVEMILSGSSLKAVTTHWEQKFGIVTSTGDRIPVGNVRRYLSSPRLVGYRMRNVPEHERGVKLNLMDFVARDPSGEPVIGQPAVCDRLTFMRLQQALAGRRTSVERERWGKHEWLLTGVIICTGCDRRMYGLIRSGGDGNSRYGCVTNSRSSQRCEHSCYVAAANVENYVVGWLLGYLTKDRLAEANVRASSREDSGFVLDLKRQLDETRLEVAELLAQQGKSPWTGAKVGLLLSMVADAQARAEGLEDRMLTALRLQAPDLPDGEKLTPLWPDMSLDRRRAIIGRVVDRIEVFPGRLPIEEKVRITPLV